MRNAEDVIADALEIVSQLSPRMRYHVARLAVAALRKEGLLVEPSGYLKQYPSEAHSQAWRDDYNGY